MDKTLKQKYQVRLYEMDHRGKAKLIPLLDYLQDAAGLHAEQLGVAVTDLKARNLTWILSRYHVKIARYPAAGETVEVETWPSASRSRFALREFEMKAKDGAVLLQATTSWLVMDLARRRPVPLEGVLPDFPLLEKRALEDDFKPLPVFDGSDRELSVRVFNQDLDWNRHVNNTVYIRWAVETVPPEVLLEKRLVEVEISYRGEAFYGETVLSRAKKEENGGPDRFFHQIVNRETGNELTRLRTVWE